MSQNKNKANKINNKIEISSEQKKVNKILSVKLDGVDYRLPDEDSICLEGLDFLARVMVFLQRQIQGRLTFPYNRIENHFHERHPVYYNDGLLFLLRFIEKQEVEYDIFYRILYEKGFYSKFMRQQDEYREFRTFGSPIHVKAYQKLGYGGRGRLEDEKD